MIAARKSTLLLLLVSAVWMDHSIVVLALEETTVTAALPTVADAHGTDPTGVVSVGENATSTGAPAEASTPAATTSASTEAPTTKTPAATTPTMTPSPTTTSSSTASSTASTAAPAATPAVHNQVATNTTTQAPTTTTAKPSSASLGAVFSVATLVFGLCLVYM